MPAKKYSTVIFDLDGTLLNTIDDLHMALNYTMSLFGVPEHSVDDVKNFVGNGVVKLMERAVPGGKNNPNFDDMLRVNNEYYLKHSTERTRPYPGIMDLLVTCRNRRIKTGVVSNKEDIAVQRMVKHYFADYIDASVGRGNRRRAKPFPDGLIELLMQLFSDRRNALYIGDSEVDAETAANAGMDCVLVSWGFRPRDILEKQKCLAVIDRPEEIIHYLE